MVTSYIVQPTPNCFVFRHVDLQHEILGEQRQRLRRLRVVRELGYQSIQQRNSFKGIPLVLVYRFVEWSQIIRFSANDIDLFLIGDDGFVKR